MFPGGIFELLKQVVTSWQVIVVTVVFILYVFIVNYTARSYHRPRTVKKIAFKAKAKKPKPSKEASSSNSNDELGLEES